MWSNGKPQVGPEKQRGGVLVMHLGEVVVNKDSTEGN